MKKLLLAFVAATAVVGAQASGTFSLDQILSYPFPDNLIGSPVGATVAWTLNERGVRNIYAADGPEFTARRVTSYTEDDGQELTSLSFSADGKTIVYVRGGDHGSNWPAEGNLEPDPSSNPVQPKVQVWAVPAPGGASTRLGDGDEPAIAPTGNRVAFVKDHRIWIAPLDGSKAAEQAFFARGASESPVWSPDGRTLAFVSNRDDHSFIGLFTAASQPIRYVAPSTSRDSDPVWSPDGHTIAYVRQPGRGGVPASPLVQQPSPWAIWVADAATGAGHEAWKSGTSLVDSIPRTAGGANLHWGTGERLVFLSYQDNWPHLYSVAPSGGARPALLTPGAFMVEYASMSPDRKFVVYNANTGPDRNDIDRRHIFKVPVDGSAPPVALTSGRGIEWTPVGTADGRTVAFLASDAQRSPLPTIVPMAGGQTRTLAADRLPASLPSAALVTPEPVTFR
ncbi:MAG TPA: DPP IV N-terminal domain-containing protein, partial [Vicinamibacterales bacterium]|nr:DPP IV N-terminal domain-containing protein [Vicinamibacterales bacterium]